MFLVQVFINFVKQQQEIVRESEDTFAPARPVGSINTEFVPLSSAHEEGVEDGESDDLPVQIEQAGVSTGSYSKHVV